MTRHRITPRTAPNRTLAMKVLFLRCAHSTARPALSLPLCRARMGAGARMGPRLDLQEMSRFRLLMYSMILLRIGGGSVQRVNAKSETPHAPAGSAWSSVTEPSPRRGALYSVVATTMILPFYEVRERPAPTE